MIASEYIKPILDLMESYPNLDYGMPGPLVHFSETFYKNGYEELLVNSVSKKPTLQTIWMLRRIINDPKLHNRTVYLEILENLLNRDDINENIKNKVDNILSK